MVQPTCMLVISSWDIDNFFFDGGSNSNALVPNTTTGWLIQVFCTYVGYICLFVGVFWTTGLHKKIARKWKTLRYGNQQMMKIPTQDRTSSEDMWKQVQTNNNDLWGALFEESKDQDGTIA